jgi:hypothetical protein
MPWIILGRIIRLVLRPVAASLTEGMAGKQILGATLMVIAILGLTGYDATFARWLGPMMPPWMTKMALTF